MSMRRKHKTELGIVELAVDPADVDRRTYPVRIRLTRPLTSWEVEGLATVVPGLRADGDAIVVPEQAVVVTQAGPTVYTVDSQGKVAIAPVRASFTHERLKSTDPGDDYTANVYLVGLRFQP